MCQFLGGWDFVNFSFSTWLQHIIWSSTSLQDGRWQFKVCNVVSKGKQVNIVENENVYLEIVHFFCDGGWI